MFVCLFVFKMLRLFRRLSGLSVFRDNCKTKPRKSRKNRKKKPNIICLKQKIRKHNELKQENDNISVLTSFPPVRIYLNNKLCKYSYKKFTSCYRSYFHYEYRYLIFFFLISFSRERVFTCQYCCMLYYFFMHCTFDSVM